MTGGIGIQNNPQEVAGVSSRRLDAGRSEEPTRAAAANVLEGHVAAVKRVQFNLHQDWRGQEAPELQYERHEQDAGSVAELREHPLEQLPMTGSIGTEDIPLEAGGVRSQDLAAERAADLTYGAAAEAFEGQVAAAKRGQFSLQEEQQHQKELALQEEKQDPVADRVETFLASIPEEDSSFDYPGRKPRRAANKKQVETEELLPPSLGAGYILWPGAAPFDERPATRVVFKIDSGCDPYCIIKRSVAVAAKLKLWKRKSTLTLADDIHSVSSEEVVQLQLRVTIGDRPRIIPVTAVVWEEGALGHELLISLTVAVKTGLSIFVHDNLLREVILGRAALNAAPEGDPLGAPRAVVGTILGEEADEDLLERISPIDGLRAAMAAAPQETDDPLVNEELRGPLRAVFGPLCKDPAKVPPLEFSVDIVAVTAKTYKESQPLRLPSASPRQCDVNRAQFGELKRIGVMADAYPDYPPGPIACIAFTVAKPGVEKLPRPANFGGGQILDVRLQAEHDAYEQSLLLDRLVCNNVPLNEVLLLQNYPLPSVQSNLAKLSKFKFFAKIDITKAFWAIPLHPNSRKWTYTVAAGGLSGVWLRAPMGAAPVPAYFMWCLHGVLSEQAEFVVLYADDVLIGAQTEEELRINVRSVLKALLEANFRINADKCSFTPAREIKYLGWIIGDGKVTAAPGALDKLWRIRKPNEELRVKDDKARRQIVRRFLGVLQYLSHYIPCGAEELRALYELTKTANEGVGGGKDYKPPAATTKESKKSPAAMSTKPFKWTPACDKAWDWAVERMKEIKPLCTPTYGEDTWLETVSDASKYGWGGILVEFRVGDPKPYLVCCVAGTFCPAQINWPVCQKEMLGIWATIKKLRHFLHLHPFVISMDHRNLLWGSMSTNEVVVRLSTDLQQHRFVMRHVEGPSNVLADYVSRAEHVSESEFARLRARGTSGEVTPQAALAAEPLAHEDEPQCAGIYEDFSEGETSSFSNFESTEGSEDEDSQSNTLRINQDSVEQVMEGSAAPIRMRRRAARGIPEPAAQPRRPRRIVVQRQPEPAIELGEGVDDGMPIPHMLPQPNLEPRRLSAEHFHTIKQYHGGVLPHTGVVNLIAALREAGHNWAGLDLDCAAFIARCHYCQLERLRRRGPESLPYRSVEIPSCLAETWHFDVLGPLEPCALSGSKWINCAVEETSRMTMTGHSIEMSTVELMLFFIDVFKVFGIPATIVSDKGAPLVSRAVKEFCDATGIVHKIGVPENHQSDGIVEGAGARIIWPYLRTMAWELQKFHAWTPLLCQVQLAANALLRNSLGGASASDIMFGRRIRPMRFLRPEALRRVDGAAPQQGRLQVNTFIADQAAFQLRLLGRAEAERHRRYRNNAEEFKEHMEGFEHLDWVQVGHLVSIPQPNHERFNRPNKWALLRRGPYEVMESQNTTLLLRDRTAFVLGKNPRTFQWPKRWVFPYHVLNEEAREEIEPPPPEEGDVPEQEIILEDAMITAIVSAEQLPVLAAERPRDVRNYQYLVRWANTPHAGNSWEQYEAVWHTRAFQEFVSGWEGAQGHVAPSQYAQRHRNHVNALVRGRRPAQADAEVLLPHAEHLERVLQGYLPLQRPPPQNRDRIVRDSQESARRPSQYSQPLDDDEEAEEEGIGQFGGVLELVTDAVADPVVVRYMDDATINVPRALEGNLAGIQNWVNLARSRDSTPERGRERGLYDVD
jgi:hypothetical protein